MFHLMISNSCFFQTQVNIWWSWFNSNFKALQMYSNQWSTCWVSLCLHSTWLYILHLRNEPGYTFEQISCERQSVDPFAELVLNLAKADWPLTAHGAEVAPLQCQEATSIQFNCYRDYINVNLRLRQYDLVLQLW